MERRIGPVNVQNISLLQRTPAIVEEIHITATSLISD